MRNKLCDIVYVASWKFEPPRHFAGDNIDENDQKWK